MAFKKRDLEIKFVDKSDAAGSKETEYGFWVPNSETVTSLKGSEFCIYKRWVRNSFWGNYKISDTPSTTSSHPPPKVSVSDYPYHEVSGEIFGSLMRF